MAESSLHKTTYSWQPFSSDTFRQLDAGPVGRFTTRVKPGTYRLTITAASDGKTVSSTLPVKLH